MGNAEALHGQISPEGNHATYLLDSTYVYAKIFENPVSAAHDCDNIVFPSLCNATYEINTDYVGDTIVHFHSATIGGRLHSEKFCEVEATHIGMIKLDYEDFLRIINYQEETT